MLQYAGLFFAILFFLVYLFLEAVGIFVRYNYSAAGSAMLGANYSSIVSIISRGFFVIYSLLMAAAIEGHWFDARVYVCCFAATLLLGALLTLFFSGRELVISEGRLPRIVRLRELDVTSCEINPLLGIFLGAQFASSAFIFMFCVFFPENRLILISLTPVFSMLGSVVSLVLVEPGLARAVDASPVAGYAASANYLRVRAWSYVLMAAVMLALLLA